MSLRYALLGFLSTEGASGYVIAREFSESMGWFWHASHSQIYPELRRLEDEGMVWSHPPDDNGGRTKRIYEISDQGRAELNAWLSEDISYPPSRDPERTKLIYLDAMPVETIRRHLERHRSHYEWLLDVYREQLRQVDSRTHPRLRKRLAARPAEEHELVAGLKALALQGNAERARREIAWAEDAMSWLSRFDEDTQPKPGIENTLEGT